MEFPFSFNEKSGLLLIFFFHGIVFSIVLLRRWLIHQNESNKWLSLLLFLCAMYIVPYMLGYAGWYSKTITSEILFFIPFMQVLLIGPIIYFYTKSLLEPSFKISKKEWSHLIPAILYLVYSLIVFITDKLILDEFYFYADYRDKDLKMWYQLVGFASISFYLIKSLQKYKLYKKVIFDTVSYANSILFKWIQNFLLAFLALIILRILFFVFNEQWAEFGSHFWYFLSFAVVSFYISLNGYENAVKSSVFKSEKISTPFLAQEEKNIVKNIDIDFWKTKILHLIDVEKIYKNPKLTLSEVSKLLETNTKTVSNTINSGFEMNFNDFINHYRIEAVKEKLKKGEHKTSTLLGIAFDCGFNSKATFNRAFKKSTTVSPKDYLQKEL
jgi:AraC-like DNA-binding protein